MGNFNKVGTDKPETRSGWLRYTTACEGTAQGVANRAADAGLAWHLKQADQRGDAVWRVEVCCSAATLRGLVKGARARMSELRAWQWFAAAPNTPALWRLHFSKWVAVRWYDSSHPLAGACACWQGDNAGDPELVPLVVIVKARGSFNLTDPLTACYWLEYLSEYPQRRAVWRAFECEHGSCDRL